MNAVTDTDDKPWYRQLWPWLVMVPPASAVVAGFITAWLAGGPPALVVDDYSEIAMSTAQQQARDQAALRSGLIADVRLQTSGEGRAALTMVSLDAADPGFVAPATLRLQLVHPTREELDREVALTRESGSYRGQIDRPSGRLYVHLSDPDASWRLVGELRAGQQELLLQARAERGP